MQRLPTRLPGLVLLAPQVHGDARGFFMETYRADEGGHQLYTPVGFGHGFCVLSETADFVYKCTAYYDAATEKGIRFDDPDVGVRWPKGVELLYSDRDRDAPRLADVA